MPYDIQEMAVEPLVDGVIDLFRFNLVANTRLIQDAHAGDTFLMVDNALRFNRKDVILLMDNNATQDQSGNLSGAEFHTVSRDFYDTNRISLEEPLEKDFLVADYGRIQKTIKRAILYEKDVLYGDRQVLNFDFVAICVEPDTMSEEWLAVQLLGAEFRLTFMVYAKSGGDSESEEYALRVVTAYADAIRKLMMGNIHLDFAIEEVPLVADAYAGDTGVYIGCSIADDWTPDAIGPCQDVEVQDNFGAQQLLNVVWAGSSSSSASQSSQSSLVLETSSSMSSATSGSSLASSITSESSASSESWSSQSVSTTEGTSQTTTSGSDSSESSTSSRGGGACWIALDAPLKRDFKMKDKAVLRKKKRYTYDSRVENIEYGSTQKGSVFLKAARISWYGKETEVHNFPQVGLGRQT